MKVVEKKMFFWGDRSYIQGTHQLYAAIEVFKEMGIKVEGILEATYKSQLLSNSRFVIFDEGDQPEKGWCTKIVLSTAFEKHLLYAYPSDDNKCDRHAGDESTLVQGWSISQDSPSIRMGTHDSKRFLTTCTELNKILLDTLLQSQDYGSWVLTQMNCQWPLDGKQIVLRLEQSIGDIMTRTSVALDGRDVGEIIFLRGVAK